MSQGKNKKSELIIKIILCTRSHISDMFRPVLIILREFLNIIKTYAKHRRFIKHIKMFAWNICGYGNIRL